MNSKKIKNIEFWAFMIVMGLTIIALEYFLPSEGTYEQDLFGVKMMIIITLAAVLIAARAIQKAVTKLYLSQSSEEEKAIHEKKQQALFEKLSSWKGIEGLLTKAKPIEDEEEIILNHDFDGIRELDNNLPPWWLYGFYFTIVFAAIYLVRYHILGAENQTQEYLTEVSVAKKEVAAYKAAQKPVDLSAVDVSGAAGKKLFKKNCAVCHAVDGGGIIGPNLTDEYWILGGGMENVYKTIAEGGRPGKGMVAWGKSLSPDKIQQLAAYVISLQGTTPEKPKDPQGDKWVEEKAEAEKEVQ